MKKIFWRVGIVIMLMLILAVLLFQFRGIFTSEEDLRTFVASTGSAAPLTLIILQLIQTIVPFVPGGIITLTGGYVFGVFLGTLYSFIGLVVGSIIVFSISRRYGRPFVKKIEKRIYIKKISLVIDTYGAPMLFLTRMLPFFPHDLLSYVIGSSKISRKKFILATALGFLPHAFVHNYIGDSVYQGRFGIGFYLVLVFFVIGGFVYIFRNKLLSFMLENKKHYKR